MREGLTPFRTFGERTAYESADLRVRAVDVGLPGGERVMRHVVRMHRSASVVLLDGHERVLLRKRHRFMQDRWGWELPGGLVDEDEDPRDAAMRELEDQTGYLAADLAHLASFQPAPDRVDAEHVVFMAREAESVSDAIRSDEVGRWEWLPLESVPELIATGQIWESATLIGLLTVLAPGQ